MTRIVAGIAGGRTLAVPPRGTRPTSERVREALFSRLEHLGVVAGARVLDLYAGSGALGLEAASRGAAEVVLVESAAPAVAVIRRNVAALGLADRVRVVTDRAERAAGHSVTAPWDLVLADPPYDLAEDALAAVLAALTPHLAADAVVVVERSTRSPAPAWPTGLRPLDPRDYGETRVWFAEPVGGGKPGPGHEPDPGAEPDPGVEHAADTIAADRPGAGAAGVRGGDGGLA